MKSIINSKVLRILTGCTAAAIAIGPLRKSKWRYPVYALAGAAIVNGLTKSDMKDVKAPMPEAAPENIRQQSIDGIIMNWEEHGDSSTDATPVIMVHGLPTNTRVWRYIIPKVIKPGVRILAWEQVGFGYSMLEGFGRDLSIPRQAEYLYNWLKQLGVKKAIFVGHDYGGGVVQRLLVNHPEVVAGVVLTDAVAYDNWPVLAVRAARFMAPVIENLPSAMIKPLLYVAVSNLGHSNKAVKEESFRLYWKHYNSPVGAKVLTHQLRHFDSKDTQDTGEMLERLNLSIPARVIWGTEDPLGLESANRLAAALNAPLIKIPGGKHFTIEDHPEVIAAVIKDVLEETIATG